MIGADARRGRRSVLAAAPSRRRQPPARTDRPHQRVPHPAGVRLGCDRAHRRRGDRRRRPGVPPSAGEERRPDADASWAWSASRCSSASRCWHGAARPRRRSNRRLQSVLSQIGQTVFGRGSCSILLQAFTAGILILAANTSFQDFPRLSSILARDGFMPSQFENREIGSSSPTAWWSSRLLAGLLDLVFHAQTHASDPALRGRRVHGVHALAVGMVRRWKGSRGGWRRQRRSSTGSAPRRPASSSSS